MKEIPKKLSNWYKQSSKDYPWRLNSSAYSIWISEIMLQQTQAQTVISYYNNWISIYPDLDNLNNANLDQLLKLWEGLGYYSRVKNIYNASKLIASQYNNQIPSTYNELISLPGIGDYTASAILSIAYNKPYPSIDGNLKRVISRVNALNKPKQNLDNFKHFVSQFFLKYNPGIINQSLMDLGREICTFRNPKCEICPISYICIAYKNNTMHLFPSKKNKKLIPTYNVTVGIIFKKNKFLISQRKNNGLLANLWELPGGKKQANETNLECLKREIKEETDLIISEPKYIGNIKHQYSHFKISIDLFSCKYFSGTAKPLSSQKIKWILKKDINKFTFPTATHKLFQLL